MMLTHGSLFSGVEGFGLGLERAGFRTVWQVEIDRFATKVLERRYPEAKRYGDIREVRTQDLERVDLLTGGFPCQDLSIAGRRAGLAGARSGLFYEFARVARELQPTWLLVENVPGLLSSNGGRDFGIVLDTLGELGYGLAWRVLDARYFGVPQRRRRVFVVGHLGGPCPFSVLFEPEGGGGDLATGGAEGPEVAGTLGGGTPGDRGWRGDLDGSGAYIPTNAYTLTSRNSQDRPESGAATLVAQIGRALTGTMGKRHDDDTDTLVAATPNAEGPISSTLRAHYGKDWNDPSNPSGPLIVHSMRLGHVNANEGGLRVEEIGALDASGAGFAVAHTLRASGFDTSEDGTGRGTPIIIQESQTGAREYEDAGTLRANAPGTQPTGSLVMETLSSNPRNRSNSNGPIVLRMREGKDGGGKGPLVREDESLTLATANGQTVFAFGSHAGAADADVSNRSHAKGGPVGMGIRENETNALRAGRTQGIADAASVRRLTPTECERLMSWPDGHTCLCGCDPYSTEACKCPDGPRYAAIGNGVVADVAEWIGRRIAIELRAVV